MEMNKRGIYLVASSKDINGHTIAFELGLAHQEDRLNLRWFVGAHEGNITSRSHVETYFRIRSAKKSIGAVTDLYPHCVHRFCVRHSIANTEKLSLSLAPAENLSYFRCPEQSSKLALVVEYLHKINRAHWVTYAFSEAFNQPCFDEVTSNLSDITTNLREKNTCKLTLNKKLVIIPCLDDQYMMCSTDISSRMDYIHLWRTANLAKMEYTCRKWQDTHFPCVHVVKGAICHVICSTVGNTSLLRGETPTSINLSTSKVVRDGNLSVTAVIEKPEQLGKRGWKPGPRSKHKRKASKPGTASTPTVAMTQ
ncbi:hypothetical protein PHMEG_00022835 [Phytophthora megakarya]|uniref:MULE transposase domain-containing protein n=1 Tax=Phytophthora megakarya TaxID=4795 RepID=A0A225VII2_9STRA|nr:hypothetical protein PHMEG_00022835 [Phytophthora megakarya]